MKNITRTELTTMLDDNEDFTLVETLPRDMFNDYHLPGAVNIPLDDSFQQNVRQHFPDTSKTIVVYCKDKTCNASEKAAQKLEELGYTDVLDYAAGKEDWKQANLQVV